jgi:hypothetical protein
MAQRKNLQFDIKVWTFDGWVQYETRHDLTESEFSLQLRAVAERLLEMADAAERRKGA